jgi:hypothetical protein
MKIIKLFLISFLLTSVHVSAQETEFSSEVETYLESNGTLNQYEYAYDELLKMLSGQYPKSKRTVQGWKYLEGNKKKAISEMQKGLVPIYQENFERSEIKLMNTFYQSEAGVQLTTDRSQMTSAQKEELNVFYNSELGKKIIEKQPVLAKAISTLSENWSRDLYETAISLLKE